MDEIELNLEIFGVFDKGIPNRERIVLRTVGHTNLASYFLFLGFLGSTPNIIFPIADQFLWLGNMVLEENSWVFVWTGKGATSMTTERHTNAPVHNIYWGKESVVFDNPQIKPALSAFQNIEIYNNYDKDVTLLSKIQN